MEDLNNIGRDTYRQADPIKISLTEKLTVICDIILTVILFGTISSIYTLFKGLIIGSSKKNINGQLALVTGGGNGIGKLIAIELAKEGCNIAIIDLDMKSTSETVKMICSLGVECNGYCVDVSNHVAVKDILKTIENDLGPVDILVNNAGVMPSYSLLECTPEDVQRILNINLMSHFWTVRTFLPGMIERKRGHIVATCSVAGLLSIPKAVSYTTSKFGVRGFMDALQDDLIYTHNEKIIKITTIFPVFMSTRYDLMEFVKDTVGNTCYLPFVNPEVVAKETVKGILYNKRYVVVPRPYSIITGFLTYLPSTFTDTYKKLLFSNRSKGLIKSSSGTN